MSDASEREWFVEIYLALLLREVRAYALDRSGDPDIGHRVGASEAWRQLEELYGWQQVAAWTRSVTLADVPADVSAAIGAWLQVGSDPSPN